MKCALEYGPGMRHRDRKKALKTRSQHLADLQTVFNRYIRMRDQNRPCISCGRHHNGQYHAGHFRSVGACPELRFNEDNVHKQCSVCNNHKSGNQQQYRLGLLERIGEARLEFLEASHPPQKLTIEEIDVLRKEYLQKIKEIAAYFPQEEDF